jgi:ADP-dependent NAD(P)H-hydrate dehydratase / NAD(P)H-hydrate epimerase
LKVFSVAEMVAAEKAADAAGVSYAQMMVTAGRGVAEAIGARQPVAGQSVLVLVGPGNNGGDGLVAGRYLAEAGADVAFYLFKPRDAASDENMARVQAMGLFSLVAESDPGYAALRRRLNSADIVIDALLGTGASRPIGGDLGRLMQPVKAGLAERAALWARQLRPSHMALTAVQPPPQPRVFVTAVDCPSGLNSDTGELDPLAIAADLTVTFAGPKRGHFIFPGAAACGELVVVDIGIDPALPEVTAVPLDVMTAETARDWLPQRPWHGHKGTFGSALIAAGSDHYWGAPLLAGRAAYRVGAGLVALAVPAAVRPVAAGQLPEATFPPVPAEAILDEASARFLLERLDRYDAGLIGPGLADGADFMAAMLAADRLPPLVIDADGLNILATMADWPQRLPANTILTPHPGEMARLMGVTAAELKAMDRVELARRQAASWNCVLLLKGAYTVIAGGDGRCTILPFANPALATAGSGDVLAGVIVGLLAQGMDAYRAAVLGGYWHAAAGQAAADAIGQAGILADEISDWLPKIRHALVGGRY